MTTNPTFHLQRAHERFQIDPMYSSVTARRVRGRDLQTLEGHVYDISEAGARVEFDEALSVGEDVSLSMTLPQEIRDISVAGRVVWTHDDVDDPGPRRVAVQFVQFGNEQDRDVLRRYLGAAATRRVR